MKIRCTIDLDKIDLDDYGSLDNGVFGIDKEGLYRLYYHNRSNLVEFEDVEEIKND